MSSYAATSDLIDWIDFDSDSTVDNTLLGDLITQASGIINDHCGRTFDAAVASDLTSDSTTMTTRFFDAMASVSGLTLFVDRDLAFISKITNGDGEVVTTDEYVTRPSNETPYYAIKLKSSAGKVWTYTSDPEDAISIFGWWHYDTAVPEPIKRATVRLTQWFYKQRSSDAVSDQPMVLASGLTIMPAKLPADVLSILAHYRAVRIGAA
jgi:hypothetical protein